VSVTQQPDGFYSNVTGQTYGSAGEAHSAEQVASGDQWRGKLGGADVGVSAADSGTSAAVFTDPSSPRYKGPGYELATDQTGHSVARLSTDPFKKSAQVEWEKTQGGVGSQPSAPQDPNGDPLVHAQETMDMLNPPKPKPADISGRTVSGAMPTAMGGPVTGSRFATPTGVSGAVIPQAVKDADNPPPDPNAPTGAPAPKLDTSASDKSVAGVNNTINQLVSLADTSPTTSAAEAQLAKSDALSKLRAADELRNNQAASLGAARSSRNRSDAGVLERAAVGESAYLGTKAQNQDVLRQAETENNLASLRATEEQTDFTNRANILSKAADLGLNVAALQVDISKADLGSINNYVNDQFQQLGIDKQVGAQEMGQILSFSQAMSAIKYDYDKMSDADQQHTLDLMMNQYGIDANTQVAMKQIQANHKGTLEKVFDGVLGLVGAAAPVAASVITAGAKKPAAA
jgi:hypothetical protein